MTNSDNIYLGTKMEIAEKDGGLGACDYQDKIDQEKEPIPAKNIFSNQRREHKI